jgi:hypothetical protein
VPAGGTVLAPRGSLVVETGTGATAFETITDGMTVAYEYGFQGGQHIWTGVRLADTTITEATVTVNARLESTCAPVGYYSSSYVVDASGISRGGFTAFVTDYANATGHRVYVYSLVVTPDGRYGEDWAVVVPQ